jgi:hypothetical protein
MLSLLGTADPAVLHEWFDKLSDGGTLVDPLAPNHGVQATGKFGVASEERVFPLLDEEDEPAEP